MNSNDTWPSGLRLCWLGWRKTWRVTGLLKSNRKCLARSVCFFLGYGMLWLWSTNGIPIGEVVISKVIPCRTQDRWIHEQKASWTSMQLQGFLRIHIRSWDSGIGIRGEVIKSICQVSTGKRSSVITFPFSGHWPLKCNSNKKYRWNHLHSSSTSSKSPTTEKIARSTTFPRYLNMFCWIRFSYVSNIRHQ